MHIVEASADIAFASWVADHTGIANATLGPTLTGGNANVTRIVESDAGRLILRHPPKETVSAKAGAGIQREFNLLKALTGSAPVPAPVAWCDDASVIGTPFALTRFVDGTAISDTLPLAYRDDTNTLDAIGVALVDAIAAVHVIDWHGRLPDNFGRPEGFLERQINRWRDTRQRDTVRDLPMIDDIAQWLLATLPADGAARIVHCDYHLDNCLFDTSRPQLNAIIDWEMATIGDPMIDLGLLLMFWNRDDSTNLGFRFVQRISNRPGIISARALADRWSDKTGLSSEKLEWYQVFAFWRLAAIVEGAYVLYRRGNIDSPYARGLEHDVPALLTEAAGLIR